MSSDWAAKKAEELLATMRGMDEVDAALFLSGALRGVRDAERFRLAKETPTATMETPPGFRKKALRVHVDGISWWMDLPDAIATTLREAARVPEGCVRDEKGKDWPRGDYAVEYLAACLDKFPALAPAASAAARGCADCGNERIMLCPFCEHDFSEQSKENDAELRQLRRENEALRAVAEAAKIVAKSHEQWKKEGCFRNPTAPRAGQFWNEWVYEQLDPALKALEAPK